MRYRPEINFSASRRAPPRITITDGGKGISVDCSPRDDSEPDYDLGFHCHTLALKCCLKLWGLSQFNPIIGGYYKEDIVHDEFFDQTTSLAINARRYIEIFDDKDLADHIVGKGDLGPLRYWDALGAIIHGQSFIAGYTRVPDSAVQVEIHKLLKQSLERELSEREQETLRDLHQILSKEPPMRTNFRLVGYRVSTDKKKNQWISIELLSRLFLEQDFTKLSEWKRAAPDFRTPIEE